MEPCKARTYPAPSEMPKVSVVIIYYNEPLSTLLRNVVNVLNLSPPELIGEVVLVDDHSTLGVPCLTNAACMHACAGLCLCYSATE